MGLMPRTTQNNRAKATAVAQFGAAHHLSVHKSRILYQILATDETKRRGDSLDPVSETYTGDAFQ
jgi:hypothetical protein